MGKDAGEGAGPAAGSTLPAPAHLGPASSGWTLYEVDVELDARIEAQYDAWLPGHVDQILDLPGFLRADILVRDDVPDGPRAGWRRRTVQYRLAERASLDSYLSEHAPRFRAEAVARFGEQVFYERRILTQSAHRVRGQEQLEFCQNCGTVLGGQYCSSCGQRARVRIISLWHLLREAAGDLTHLDSRLWRTIWPLLARPGVLTNEYLAGRRARYIPPFRLYLGLSIIFFVLASLGGDVTPDLFAAGGTVTGENLTPQELAQIQQEIDAGRSEAIRELRARGYVLEDPADGAGRNAQTGTSAPVTTTATATSGEATGGTRTVRPMTMQDTIKCDELRLNLEVPGRERLETSLRQTCGSITRDNGRAFGRALVDNIPKMMFVFLPLLALANKLLYPLSRRYYVEHLLFYVHFHAFAFLLFSVQTLLALASEAAGDVLTVAIFIYVPFYLYKALRRVYGQGRAATLFKFAMVYVAYVVCMTLTLLGGLLYTALTL